MLIRQNVLTEDELKKALELQKGSGKKIGEVLVDNGFITEDMIVRALQMQLGLKVVQLTGVTIPKEVRNLVSVDLLKKYTCIPFELDPYNANILHLAMADPMDMAAIDDISIVTNLQIEPYIATTRDILAAIDKCYGASETLDAARRFTQERAQLRGGVSEDDSDTDESLVERYQVQRLKGYKVPDALQEEKIRFLCSVFHAVIPYVIETEKIEFKVSHENTVQIDPLQFSEKIYSSDKKNGKYKINKVILNSEDFKEGAFQDTFIKMADILLHTYGSSRSEKLNVLLTHMGEYIIKNRRLLKKAEEKWDKL